jgi:hypothetical protein
VHEVHAAHHAPEQGLVDHAPQVSAPFETDREGR